MSNGTLSLAETSLRKGPLVTKRERECERWCGFGVTVVIREEGFNQRPSGTRRDSFQPD